MGRTHIECSDDDCTYFTDQDDDLPLGRCPYCGSRMILDEDFLDGDDSWDIEFELDSGDDDYAIEGKLLIDFEDEDDE